MTREQAYNKFKELLKETNFNDYLDKKIQSYLNSGAIDCESYEENFLLPKILLSAALNDMAWQYKPLDKKAQKLVKELSLF